MLEPGQVKTVHAQTSRYCSWPGTLGSLHWCGPNRGGTDTLWRLSRTFFPRRLQGLLVLLRVHGLLWGDKMPLNHPIHERKGPRARGPLLSLAVVLSASLGKFQPNGAA